MYKKGFTLIELMLVITIIAIIAAIAIPGFLRAKMTANEGDAIAGVRTISRAEDVYRSSAIEDDDNNSTGEYGMLLELVNENATTVRLGPFIPQSMSPIVTGIANRAIKAGYRFTIFPGDVVGVEFGPSPDEQAESSFFIAYAWPESLGNTGSRTFAVDQTNEMIFQVVNGSEVQYTNLPVALEPAATDARRGGVIGGPIAANSVGNTPATWAVVGN